MDRNARKTNFKIFVGILIVILFFVMSLLVAGFLGGKVGESDADLRQVQQPVDPTQIKSAVNASPYLILVNKTHGVGRNYRPGDLTPVGPAVKGDQELRKTAARAFKQMIAAAEKAGCHIKVTSAFRSYALQEELYKGYVNKDGQEDAEHYSARPGYSEHQTGLAADVSAASVNYQLVQSFGTTKEGKWLAENAYRYGFIIRYPKGKEAITGYEYEPWHLRYVGTSVAAEMYQKGITLEEYLKDV